MYTLGEDVKALERITAGGFRTINLSPKITSTELVKDAGLKTLPEGGDPQELMHLVIEHKREFASRVFEVFGEEGIPAVYTGIPPEEPQQNRSRFSFPNIWPDLSEKAQKSVPLVTHEGYRELADYVLAHPEQVNVFNIIGGLGPCTWMQGNIKSHLEQLFASSPRLQDKKFQVEVIDTTDVRIVGAAADSKKEPIGHSPIKEEQSILDDRDRLWETIKHISGVVTVGVGKRGGKLTLVIFYDDSLENLADLPNKFAKRPVVHNKPGEVVVY